MIEIRRDEALPPPFLYSLSLAYLHELETLLPGRPVERAISGRTRFFVELGLPVAYRLSVTNHANQASFALIPDCRSQPGSLITKTITSGHSESIVVTQAELEGQNAFCLDV